MRQDEDVKSQPITLLPAFTRVEVLELGPNEAKRMKIRTADKSYEGWVSLSHAERAPRAPLWREPFPEDGRRGGKGRKGGKSEPFKSQRAVKLIEEADAAAVMRLLTEGADLRRADHQGRLALNVAVQQNQLELCQRLVTARADVNTADGRGWTPVLNAAREGLVDILEFLLHEGAVVTYVNPQDGRTALHHACRYGHDSTVGVLIDKRADVNKQDQQGWTSLHNATRDGHDAIVRMLIDARAEVNLANDEGWTPLHNAVRAGRDDILQLLFAAGAQVVKSGRHGWTALHHAVRNGRTETVMLLMHMSAFIQETSKSGWTPLHCAARGGHADVIQILLEMRAQVGWDHMDPYGNPRSRDFDAVWHAAFSGSREALELLINARGNVDNVGTYGRTTLMRAVRTGKLEAVEALLDVRADVHATSRGYQALERAAGWGLGGMVKLLMGAGVPRDGGLSAWIQALANGHYELCKDIRAGFPLMPLQLAGQLDGDVVIVKCRNIPGEILSTVELASSSQARDLPSHIVSQMAADGFRWAKLDAIDSAAVLLRNQEPAEDFEYSSLRELLKNANRDRPWDVDRPDGGEVDLRWLDGMDTSKSLPVAARHLKLIRPDGLLLDEGPTAPPLSEQLGLGACAAAEV